MHARSHHRRRIGAAHANGASLAKFLRHERVLVRNEIGKSRRTGRAGHSLVLHAVFQCVRDAIQRSDSLAAGTSLIRGCSFSEKLRVELDDGVETWSLEIVRVNAEEVFGYELDAGDCS
jgi:hypothetical protein